MSYIVLARKYRPQSFAEVYAQDHVTNILQSSISLGRIAHAYLFTGPRGVGKTSMARIMAKSLNCEKGPTTDPCNVCTNCTEITSGISPDVIEIDGASNTGVDDIRELQRELMYAASGSKYKIYIIDEVHMLSKNAFNALLKTLEEPPENVIFIFATTEPHKVLPTIISRCQRYDFKRIPVEDIVNRLRELSDREGIKIDNESLYLIARKADGGLRDALSLMDQTISYCMNDIQIDKVRQIFGLIPNQVYHGFMRMIHEHDTPGMIAALHKIFEEGTDLQEFIVNMLEYLRIVLLRQTGMQVKDVNPDEYESFDEVTKMFSQNDLMYIIGMLIQSRNDIRTSNNPYLIIETMMIRLSRMDQLEDLAQLINNLKQGGGIVSTKSAQNSNPTAPSRVAPKHVQKEAPAIQPVQDEMIELVLCEAALRDNWAKITARIRKISMHSGIVLDKATIVKVNERALTLKVDSLTALNTLKSNTESIQAVLADIFGTEVRLQLELEEKEPPTKVEIKRKNIDDIKADNPEIAAFIEQTGAKLV